MNNKKPFTSYKVSTDGNQSRRDFNRGLTLTDCQKLPMGIQQDSIGNYVWQYGVNDGIVT